MIEACRVIKVKHRRVISVVDTQARHIRKTSQNRHEGFKARVVAEPSNGLVVGQRWGAFIYHPLASIRLVHHTALSISRSDHG